MMDDDDDDDDDDDEHAVGPVKLRLLVRQIDVYVIGY